MSAFTDSSPHADALDLAQLLDANGDCDGGGDGADAADAPEAEVGLLDEVFKVHAVEGGEEGAGGETEGPDGEAEVEEHEGVAVGVEDGFDARRIVSMRNMRSKTRN